MSSIVMDASVALRAVYAHEKGHDEVLACLQEIVRAGVEPIAPDVFPYEVGTSIRRGSGTARDRTALMFDAIQLVRLVRPARETLAKAQGIAATLSFYDAAYVALAEELGAPLWTEDATILKAAPAVALRTADVAGRARPA